MKKKTKVPNRSTVQKVMTFFDEYGIGVYGDNIDYDTMEHAGGMMDLMDSKAVFKYVKTLKKIARRDGT